MKVTVAMSGGVDSTIAASILASSGHEVSGITFLTGFEKGGTDSAVARAAAAAGRLGIAHSVLDVSSVFVEKVVSECSRVYVSGRTPNPCAICNPWIKFGVVLEAAFANGADAFATGHYARIVEMSDRGRAIGIAADPRKDQSYFLYRIGPDVLEKVMFPLGGLTKPEVKAEAERLGLECAGYVESQDICFASADRELSTVLRDITGCSGPAGSILSTDGRLLGTHDGIDSFTVGQRRGLGIATGSRAWVSEIRENGDVVLTSTPEDLDGRFVIVHDAVFNDHVPAHGVTTAKVRYAQKAVECEFTRLSDSSFSIEFKHPVRAITPGQAAVVYCDGLVSAGGWIARHDSVACW